MLEQPNLLDVQQNQNFDRTMPGKQSVVMIGLDALDPILLSLWLDELPTFRSLINDGTFGAMHSTIPPLTVPAWATMLTGKRPAKLGNFGLVDLERDYSMRPVDPAIWRGQYIWDLLGARDLRVGILGLPFLSSPYPVNGFLISDLTYGELKAFPEGFSTGIHVRKPTGSMRNQLGIMWENIEQEKRFVLDVLENEHLDFFFFAMTVLDRSMHLGTRREIKNAYRRTDRFLSEIIPACKNRQILIVSDHGCKETTRAFSVGTLLEQSGLLRFQRTSMPGLRLGLARLYMSLIFRFPSLRLLLESLFDAKIVRGWRRALVRPNLLERIDMKNTQLFPVPMAGGSWFGLWINRVREFDLGIVEPGSEDKIKSRLLDAISRLRDPDNGRLVVRNVLTRTDLGYDQSSRFPDLAIQAQDAYIPIFMDLPGSISVRYRELTHSDNGVFLAVGPGLKRRHTVTGVELADMTPTVLHILGLPVPQYMEGRVVSDIFEPTGEFATRRVKRETIDETSGARSSLLTEEEEEKIADRLKALGYLG